MRLHIIFWLALLTLLIGSCSAPPPEPPPEPTREDEIRGAVLTYLSSPDYMHPDFFREFTDSEVELLVYNEAAGDLYCRVDSTNYSGKESLLAICKDTAQIELGVRSNDSISLGIISRLASDKEGGK